MIANEYTSHLVPSNAGMTRERVVCGKFFTHHQHEQVTMTHDLEVRTRELVPVMSSPMHSGGVYAYCVRVRRIGYTKIYFGHKTKACRLRVHPTHHMSDTKHQMNNTRSVVLPFLSRSSFRLPTEHGCTVQSHQVGFGPGTPWVLSQSCQFTSSRSLRVWRSDVRRT